MPQSLNQNYDYTMCKRSGMSQTTLKRFQVTLNGQDDTKMTPRSAKRNNLAKIKLTKLLRGKFKT